MARRSAPAWRGMLLVLAVLVVAAAAAPAPAPVPGLFGTLFGGAADPTDTTSAGSSTTTAGTTSTTAATTPTPPADTTTTTSSQTSTTTSTTPTTPDPNTSTTPTSTTPTSTTPTSTTTSTSATTPTTALTTTTPTTNGTPTQNTTPTPTPTPTPIATSVIQSTQVTTGADGGVSTIIHYFTSTALSGPSGTSTSSSASSSPTDGSDSGVNTGKQSSIVGFAIAGSVAVLGIVGFIVWKFTRKRLSDDDFDTHEAIKWPELDNVHGGPSADAKGPFAGGAGGDDSRSVSQGGYAPTLDTASTADMHAYADPYAVPALPHLNPATGGPYHDDPNGDEFYDPYGGPVPRSIAEPHAPEAIPMTQLDGRRSPGPMAAYDIPRMGSPGPGGYGAPNVRAGSPGPGPGGYGAPSMRTGSPGPGMAYGAPSMRSGSPGPGMAYAGGRASPGPNNGFR